MQFDINKNEISETREKLFWIFQLLYWSVHWAVNFVTHPVEWYRIPDLLDLSLTIFMGFLLSLLLKYIFDRYSIHKFPVLSLAAVFFLYSFFCGLVFLFAGIYISFIVAGEQIIISSPGGWVKYIVVNTYPFFIWSALYVCYKIWNEWKFQKIKAEKERSLAQSAQLEMLRYQLNPHFLYNSLSSLRALIRIDSHAAEQMVTGISEFLRYSLSYENENEVSLCREVDILRHYLDIEKVRFGDKICVDFNIDENSENYPVPVFLIHPLVENAVKHGMKTSAKPLKIIITSRVIENELNIEVFNSGTWQENNGDGCEKGKGLINVNKRLELSYPGNFNFEIVKGSDNVIVKISIFRVNR